MPVDLREIDPQNEPLVRRHWEIGKAAEDAHRPYDFHQPWKAAWITYSSGREDTDVVLLGAFEGDRMWGAARINHPLYDNTHLTYAEFFVHPDRQRRGVGRSLVEAGYEIVRRNGRRVMVVECYSHPTADSAGLLFARALGSTEALEEGIKVVDLPATEELWPELAAQAAAHHQDYEIITWHGATPPEYVEGYCRMNEDFNAEAPLGGLDIERERWNDERLRAREERARRAGRQDVTTVAVAGDGAVVGFTGIFISVHAPERACQFGTLVVPEHRGHRLGLAMKVENQRAVRDRFPECKVLMTGNASVNAPMNAVNDRLGVQVIERCVEVQKDI